ncbi:hypothetical protein ACJEPZ_28310, partial [Klebsiella pneumoniae]|uniref:hypothetical protein n=1 Tax=Klebsiella pneumoniae TaxID=573 RepID=UPI003871011A
MPETVQLRNTGTADVLVDGMVFEKADYIDWDFAIAPGTLAAGAKYTTPNQPYLDVAGMRVQAISVPMFD